MVRQRGGVGCSAFLIRNSDIRCEQAPINREQGCNFQPSTFNHQPSTINHQPSTINSRDGLAHKLQWKLFDESSIERFGKRWGTTK
jgi:hypothetical protein